MACAFLNRLFTKEGVRLVISSQWRVGRTRKNWEDLLLFNGINPEALYFGDAWKTHVTHQIRGEEIDLWLHENKEWDNYVIVDDTFEFFKHQEKHCVITEGLEGLQSKDFKKICDILEISLLSLN